MSEELDDADYVALAEFRFELRNFLRFSEQAARSAGLAPQQHQALLSIRASGEAGMRVGELADRLLLKPHSASELVQRLLEHDLVIRQQADGDRRQVHLALSHRAGEVLASLSASHRVELRRLRPLLLRLLDAL